MLIRNSLCFKTKNIEDVFFDEIFILNVKPIAIGIFYRPPKANDFLNTFSKDF